MGWFGNSRKLSKQSETSKEKNKDTVRNSKIFGGTIFCKSGKRDDQSRPSSDLAKVNPYEEVEELSTEDQLALGVKSLNFNTHLKKAYNFTLEELTEATGNFRSDLFLGEGGFGKVFKGNLKNLDLVVAIKQLDHNGHQGKREFVAEVVTLSLADHPNLVKLIGFCDQSYQKLLVYEYLPLGSLDHHLHNHSSDKNPLDWNTRMKIAAGAARGLEYLHYKMNPPVIYRDLKCSNILLGEDYHPKLSDFGLAKVGPTGDKTHVSTRVMGSNGYCAPDYAMTGQLTAKSDIYSFGVVLLELITGRKAFDKTKPLLFQNLVGWARPLFKDKMNFTKMVDPVLQGRYPVRGLYQALAISARCVQEEPSRRPVVSDLVLALDFLASSKYDPNRDRDDEEKKPNFDNVM